MEAVTRELAERVTDTPVDITIVDREIAEITESLHNHQSRHRTLLEELHLDRQLQSSLNQANELSSRIIDLHRRRDASTKEEVVHYIASLIDEVIVMHNLRLTSLERSLTTIDIQKGIVSSLEKSISAKEFDLRLLKLAISALSPTEGLIARGMGGFINRFVHDVNAFIENFWLYPLALETMDVSGDEVDLDYKFMVRVNSDHVVKDIQESSRGQREVINLAIRATCMKYLGLRQYPLFLDEFAARMDPAHRKAAYDAIDKLIESEEYSQIFLVSH
jgi:DNA repair exonuclease SbcCD ATPase subunit